MNLVIVLALFSVQVHASYVSRYIPDNFVSETFHIPKGLERAVDFWIDVYSKYDSNNIIIHDAEHNIVYDVIDTSDVDTAGTFSDAIKQEIVDSRVISLQKKYRDALKMIAQDEGAAKKDIWLNDLITKFKDIDEIDKFLNASRPGRVRAQKGQVSFFKKGIEDSSKYLTEMENCFKQEGLPVELTRIPFVESYFDTSATSRTNASGIWQFMKGTGGEYLKVKNGYDERRDPALSTHAAAKLLKRSYDYLGKDWALAITAYNHGMYGMKRAMTSVGSSDIVKIIREYKGDKFGFASKNFYAEFLAALYVERNHDSLFDNVDRSKFKASNYGTIVTVKPMNISQLELLLDVDKEELRQYNPALSKNVFAGHISVPEGVKLRVPINRFKRLLSRTEVVKGITSYVKFM